jgi:hypothetical protein
VSNTLVSSWPLQNRQVSIGLEIEVNSLMGGSMGAANPVLNRRSGPRRFVPMQYLGLEVQTSRTTSLAPLHSRSRP